MQEDVERRTLAISISATKLTGQVLALAWNKVSAKLQDNQTPYGKQSVKKLMNHQAPTNSMPLDGDTKLFDRLAQKYNVDYAFHKTGPGKYMLFFKSSQADAITACFSEYTKQLVAKGPKPPSILAQLKKSLDLVKSKPKAPERVREAVIDERS